MKRNSECKNGDITSIKKINTCQECPKEVLKCIMGWAHHPQLGSRFERCVKSETFFDFIHFPTKVLNTRLLNAYP